MPELVFDVAEVLPLFTHAKASQAPTTEEEAEAGLFLNHDQGVFLSVPGLAQVARAKDKSLSGGPFRELIPLIFFEGIETTPDETFTIHWEDHSFDMRIPAGLTRAEILGRLAKAVDRGEALFFETPHRKRLLGLQGLDIEDAKLAVEEGYPKAVIFDDLDEEQAIALYAQAIGAKILD